MGNNRKDTKTGILATRSIAILAIIATVLSVCLCLLPIFTGRFYAKRAGITENLKVEDPTVFWIFLIPLLAVTAYIIWLTVKIVISAMKTFRQ